MVIIEDNIDDEMDMGSLSEYILYLTISAILWPHPRCAHLYTIWDWSLCNFSLCGAKWGAGRLYLPFAIVCGGSSVRERMSPQNRTRKHILP